MRRKSLLAAVLSLALFCTACLGPNRAFNSLHDWNEQVSDDKWVNEGVFLAFTIIPVYGVAYLLDIVIFNSVEWWTGENPMDK